MAPRNNKNKTKAEVKAKVPKDSLKTTRRSYRKSKVAELCDPCEPEICEDPCEPCEPEIVEEESCESEIVEEPCEVERDPCSKKDLCYKDRSFLGGNYCWLLIYILIFIILACAIYYAFECYKAL